jgi:hypothetical protein
LFILILWIGVQNTIPLFVSLLTNFTNELTLFNTRANFINKVLKLFLTTRNLPRKFLCWQRPYSRMKKSMLRYMSSLIRIYWCKNIIFSSEACTGNCCLLFTDLHTSLSITSVLLLFLVCSISVYMTINLVFQCADIFWFFAVAASKETNTLHLLPKDRCYFSFCIHCSLIPLILSVTAYLKLCALDIYTAPSPHLGNF